MDILIEERTKIGLKDYPGTTIAFTLSFDGNDESVMLDAPFCVVVAWPNELDLANDFRWVVIRTTRRTFEKPERPSTREMLNSRPKDERSVYRSLDQAMNDARKYLLDAWINSDYILQPRLREAHEVAMDWLAANAMATHNNKWTWKPKQDI